MDEFLAVAKLLEITELCKTKTNDELEDEPSTTNPGTSKENLKEKTIVSDNFKSQTPQESRRENVNVNGKYECEPCQKTFNQRGFYYHKQSVHQGVKFACDQCHYQATQKSSLTTHIKSMHEGVRYVCDQCDQQFTQKSGLNQHKKTFHQGVNYKCNQCDYQATQKVHLRTHMKNMHIN